MIVIIKPAAKSKFQNFVDAIDQMKIAGIQSYTTDDENISNVERKFMHDKSL